MDLRISSDESLGRQFRKSDIVNLATITTEDRSIIIYHYPDLNCFYLNDYNKIENKKYKIYDVYDMEMQTSYYSKIIRLRDNERYKVDTKINRILELLFCDDSRITIEEN